VVGKLVRAEVLSLDAYRRNRVGKTILVTFSVAWMLTSRISSISAAGASSKYTGISCDRPTLLTIVEAWIVATSPYGRTLTQYTNVKGWENGLECVVCCFILFWKINGMSDSRHPKLRFWNSGWVMARIIQFKTRTNFDSNSLKLLSGPWCKNNIESCLGKL